MLIRLANFISGTKYRVKPFSGANDLRDFIRKAGSYSALISHPKYELEKKTPKDLFNYIIKTARSANYHLYPKSIGTASTYTPFMDHGNSRQVFEYILSTTTEERAQSYFNVFSRLKHCTIPQPRNLFLVYYVVQTLYHNLQTVNVQMMNFLKMTSSSRPSKHVSRAAGEPMAEEIYIKAYEDSMSFLERVYRPKLQTLREQSVEYKLEGDFSRLIHAPYQEETFLLPRQIANLIAKSGTDLSGYQEIINYILLNNSKYRLDSKDRVHYLNNFNDLLKINPLYMQNNVANSKTLLSLARKVYSQDLAQLRKKLPGKGNCSSALKYVKDYVKVLKETTSSAK